MAYNLYTTEGIVLKGEQTGEADKYLYIFTEGLGLIRAFAKSVRREDSKLNSGLLDFSLSTITVVKGKVAWRITSATSERNLYKDFQNEKDKLRISFEVLRLLRSLVTGERADKKLFQILTGGFDFLKKEIFSKDECRLFEIVLVFRILEDLGYIARKKEYENILDAAWSKDVIRAASDYKREILQDINKAIEESHLS
jgi:DNA repair protein RecO